MADYPASIGQLRSAQAYGTPIPRKPTKEKVRKLNYAAACDPKVPANPAQLKLAASWGVEHDAGITRGDLHTMLMDMWPARAWVYSVCRKMTGAKWRHYRESGLSDQKVFRLAFVLTQNDEMFQTVQARDPSGSSTGYPPASDDWYLMTAKATKSDAYVFIAELAQRDLGIRAAAVAPAKRSKPRRGAAPAPAPSRKIRFAPGTPERRKQVINNLIGLGVVVVLIVVLLAIAVGNLIG